MEPARFTPAAACWTSPRWSRGPVPRSLRLRPSRPLWTSRRRHPCGPTPTARWRTSMPRWRLAVSPYVEALLDLRGRARDNRDYASSDWIRDRLTAAGVEVRDTPDGVIWEMR